MFCTRQLPPPEVRPSRRTRPEDLNAAGTELPQEKLTGEIRQYAQLELNVVAGNERAISMYRDMGFVEFGRNPRGFNSRESGFQELIQDPGRLNALHIKLTCNIPKEEYNEDRYN